MVSFNLMKCEFDVKAKGFQVKDIEGFLKHFAYKYALLDET